MPPRALAVTERMKKRIVQTASSLAFGNEPRRRPGLSRSLTASVVYLICLVAQWAGVELGQSDASNALWLTVYCLFGAFGFFVVIRSGLTQRYQDAALTMMQMVFAIVAVALAYRLNPRIREATPIIVALILVFGAFILPSKRCRDLGWFAVIALGCAMALGVWNEPERFDATGELFAFVITAVAIPALSYLAGQLSQLRIDQKRQKRELRELMEQLRTIATHDELTGLPNRRHIQEWMAHEIARTQRQKSSLCLAIIDLDRFKRINDTFGHAAGDEALRVFAREASTGLRAGDVLARWGGEEFLLVMPDTPIVEAQAALERVRAHIARPESWNECPQYCVTFSAGVTTLTDPQTLEQALQWADFALYEAKGRGRDRIVATEPEDVEPSASVIEAMSAA
jgi:diguanylate cyclase (GGDEF)-like protein